MEKQIIIYEFFIGIDISKTYFDVTIIDQNGKKVAYKRFLNKLEGYMAFLAFVGKSAGPNHNSLLFCMEHTGIYGRSIQHFLQDHSLNLWIESGLQIKYSQGIQRGKNDKIDSLRIANYGLEKQKKVNLTPIYDVNIEQMHDLLACRNRLVSTYNALRTPQEELKNFDENSYKTIKEGQQNALKGIKESIENVEKQIDLLIEKNPDWKKNIDLALTIKGLGKITILWLLIYTRNFDQKYNARRIAAFVGIAPYEKDSGTSVKGGVHISNFAHTSLKTLLHLSAMSALRFNKPIKQYKARKKAEGKKGFVVMNNVKNKLVHQLVAVIKTQKPFDNDFIHRMAA